MTADLTPDLPVLKALLAELRTDPNVAGAVLTGSQARTAVDPWSDRR